MPTDHDTYLHKVASAPAKEQVPPADTQPIDAVTMTDTVTPPKNVLPGELVTSAEDESPEEFAPSEQDAPMKPEAEAAPEFETEAAPGPDAMAGPEAIAEPEAMAEPEVIAESEAMAESEPTLLANGDATREKWMRLQASFVDDPRAAVTEGAALVADVLAQMEAAVRGRQQPGGDTEALRLQMRQYRLLVDRLTGL